MLRPIKIIIAGVDNFSKTFEQMSSKMRKIGAGMSTVGKAMTAGITLPVLGAGIAAMKFSNDLNAAMANVQSLGLSTKRVQELKANIQDLAVKTGKSTVLISQGLYDMISAFGDSADTAKLLEINVKASAAGLSTVQDAIALTSAVSKGYGDTSAKAVQKVSDLAFQTVKLGQTTFPELAQSMGRVVPLASALGVSQEELFSVFATATGVTGKAVDVSTQFRNVLQALMAPSDRMKQLMQAFGIANGEAMIKQKGLAGSVQFLVEKAKQAKMPLQELIGSIEGQTIALALAGSQASVWSDKMVKMKSTMGATDQAFKDQTQGINKIGFKFQQMQQKLTVFLEKLGDTIAPIAGKLIDALSPVLDVISNMSPEIMVAVSAFALLLAAVGPMLIIGVQLISALSTITTAIGAAGGALAILSNPIGWVIGAIGLLAAAVTFIVAHWESKWAKLMMVIFPLAGIVGFIIKRWGKLKPFFTLLLLPLRLLFEGLWLTVKWVFGHIADFMTVILTPLGNFIDNTLDTLNKLMGMALPDWVKKRIGLDVTTTTTASDVAQNAAAVDGMKSEFSGVLTIKGAPKGSTLSVTKGDMDTEFDNGAIMGGAY
jgi:TP901 family phage tail tape measure protein